MYTLYHVYIISYICSSIHLVNIITAFSMAGSICLNSHSPPCCRSVTDTQKRALLRRATALLYTPDREHFGIVPVEAMYSRCPVIAVRPLRTLALV